MNQTTLDILQGELERLFDLPGLMQLCAEVLGFDPAAVGGTGTKGTFARSLVGYCSTEQALQALVDAIMLSSQEADTNLRKSLSGSENGELTPGTKVGGLEVVKKLGEGGLGVVYLARDERGAQAALKVFRHEHSRDRAAVHRFTTASRVIQTLDAPGLGSIVAVGRLADARPWVAAQLMSGQSLADRIKKLGPLHINEARGIFAGVLHGLSALHARGLAHGDVKTQNVFVVRSDSRREGDMTGVLVDAGTDRLVSRTEADAARAGVLSIVGSAKSMAPEQARGAEPDARSDVYGMGTLIFEALTGRPPFIGESAIDVIAQHLSAQPEPPSAYARKGFVSQALDEVVLRALAKDPSERYQSAEALIEALDAAALRPGKRKPLDEVAFNAARSALVNHPGNHAAADDVENQAHASGVPERAATVFVEVARTAHDGEHKLSLLFRAARIYETELKDALRAEASYQQILELDPTNAVALHGLEAARRASGDHQGLIGILLDRIDREQTAHARAALLHEVATLYEEKLHDPNHAVMAWAQALVNDPSDTRALRSVERLASASEARLAEAVETVSAAAQDSYTHLFGDESAARAAAEQELAQAQADLEQMRAYVEQSAQARADVERQGRAAIGDQVAAAEHSTAQAYEAVEALQAQHGEVSLQARQLAAQIEERRAGQEAAEAAAEEAVEVYEQRAAELGEVLDDAQQAELAELAADAEQLVEAASADDGDMEATQQQLAELHGAVAASEAALLDAQRRAEAADEALSMLRGDDVTLLDEVDDGDDALSLSDEEAEHLGNAEARVEEAERALARYADQDESERASRRKQELADLVQLYVILGRWYATRLARPDLALQCYSQALAVEPEHDAAFDGIIELYRTSQAFAELAMALLSRADRANNAVKARACRAQAAVILLQKLGDEAQARAQLERVLSEDPSHSLAQETLGEILLSRQDFPALADLYERRIVSLDGDDKVEAALLLAEICEDRLQDLERAESHYRVAAAAAPRKLDAWKGLERIYARNENFDGLLESLRAQVELASTPRQRIGLFERIGLLLEEEFVSHADAATAFEDIVAIDASHDAANTALARLYRQLSRFEDVVTTLQRHANSTPDDKRKVELMLQAVRVLTVDIGSPDRAMEMCERVLEVDAEQAEALSELARMKSTAGDVSSALAAVERLADNETDPLKRAEHHVRAGKLLEDSGDRDGAISRYKKALDADKNAVAAAEALRSIYAKRGDAHGAIEMLLHAIERTEGERQRAQLFAELGALYHERLEDEDRAEEAFNTALGLDATSTVAQVGLGRIAFARGKHEVAAEHLGAALARVDELPKDQAADVCLQAGESWKALGQSEKALDAFRRARDFMPDDLSVNERHAAMVLESGAAKTAEGLYERIFQKFEQELDVAEKCRVLRAWGEAQLGAKHAKQAIDTFRRVLELRSDDQDALDGLTRGYEEARNFGEVINLLQLRSRRATDAKQRFELLVRTGDVFLEKLRDRDAAAQTYVMALDLEPDNRNLLTKLMAVYSDAQDWSRLIEIILRIADMVQQADQLAKYFNTAATIAHHELGRFDEAANYYEQALLHVPPTGGQAQLTGLVACLTQNQDWERLARAYETRVQRMRAAGIAGAEIAVVLDAHADMLAQRLGRTTEALALYEEAQSLDPQNRARRDMLTGVYSKEPKKYFARAVASHRELLAEDPYRVESMQSLRRIYTSGKRPDESWCLAQALRCLQMADVDEEKFFKKYRLASLPKARRPIDEDLYRRFVWHPSQDTLLTTIFAALSPAITTAQSQPLQSFGVDPRNYTDPASDPTAMGRMLAHVGEMTAMRLPDVYHVPSDPGGLSFLFSAPPAVGIGSGARAGGPQQALAFVAGRHLSYFRVGHYIRQLVPTGTGLRAWLFASIRMISPKFPIPATMENQVRECGEAIRTQLGGPHRDALRSMTQKLLEAAPELDMKGWMAGVDLSADRLGFVLSNDLKVASAVIEASPEDSAVISRKDRMRELMVYSISEPYFELRKAIGISLGG